MEDEASKMKALFARARATREETAPSSTLLGASERLTVPRCAYCGAPREAAVERAVHGALARACRYCNTRCT